MLHEVSSAETMRRAGQRGAGGRRRALVKRGVDRCAHPAHPSSGATGPRGTILRMSSHRPNGGFTLVEVINPRVLEAIAQVDAMSDEEIRELVDGEPPIIVEAGEGIIADRRAEQAGSEHTS